VIGVTTSPRIVPDGPKKGDVMIQKQASARWSLSAFRYHMTRGTMFLAKRRYRQAWSSMTTAMLYLDSAALQQEIKERMKHEDSKDSG
jgi:hypothetical protein